MPAVSIIIPTRNRGSELAEALESVKAQRFQDWEALVIDDASDEDIAAVVRQAGDQRISYARLPQGRSGAPAARNFGVEQTSGEFVLFLDSDDLLDPGCLEQRLIRLRERPELDLVVFACQQFRHTPGDLPLLWNVLGGPEDDDLDRFLRGDIIWQTSSPLWRREALAKIGPWDEACLSGQDWEYHLRALLAGVKYEKVDEIDHHWRIASPTRESIGKSAALDKRHALAWSQTLDRLCVKFRDAGRFDAAVRRRFAALYFHSARQIAAWLSRRTARHVWCTARRRGLVNRRQFIEGWTYLFGRRWPSVRPAMERHLARRWPAAFLAPQNGTFNRARAPGAPPPRVSVIMAVHNGDRYLEEAIHSISRQTYRDLELLVCDDGSTDGTAATLQRLSAGDCRIRVFSPGRIGFVNALNLLHEHAQGELVARMDGDDVALPERIEKQVAFLDAHPDAVLVGTQCQDIDPCGLELAYYELPRDHDDIEAELLRGHGGAIRHPAAMYRLTTFRQVGGYRRQWEWIEDIDLFLRMAEVGRLANLDEVLLKYRIHPRSSNHLRQQEQLRKKEQLVAEIRARRGLEPVGEGLNRAVPDPPAVQFERWGWRALKVGRADAARQHALALLRLRPLSRASWRLMFCAARGR